MSDNHQALRSALTEMRKQAAMHNTEWTSEIGETNEWGTRCFEIHGERVQELATAYGESTAAYIAACNPIAIAAILSELEALRGELQIIRAVSSEYDEFIRFHSAGNGDFDDFISKKLAAKEQQA